MTDSPYRQSADRRNRADAEIALFRLSLARQRARVLFAVTYPVAVVVILGIASSFGVGASLVAISVLAMLPKAMLSAKGRRLW